MSIPYKVSLCLTHANPTATIPYVLVYNESKEKKRKAEND